MGMGSWERRDPAGARAVTGPAYIPQVNCRCALGKEAWVCSMLQLKREWEGAAVPEDPPVSLSELPAGLTEAKALEPGLKLHHFGS